MNLLSRPHLRATYLLTGALVAAGLLVAPNVAQADNQSLSVNFAAATTAPTYRASGWIYGMTENGTAPPDHFFTDIKYQAMRAGGAQLPGSGWVGGGYDRRWNATRAQMLRTKALGGKFVLLPHDLWGADGAPISRFPGDNGNWTDYNNFLTRVINDVKATGVPVEWDIWNEPNITLFWNRPQAQYFELWRRTYQRLRADMPGTLIVGPSLAGVPTTSGTWWNQYLDYIKANNAVPDIVSWHSLPSDPVANVAAANTTLDSRGIPHPRPYQINEYGASNEQNPGDGAWYITRLERAGADGLRANWASGGNLHNDLGNLLTHNSAGQYQPKGEWWVYRFYAQQTGVAVATTASAGYDAYATKAAGDAKILVGGGRTTGNIAVNLQGLNSTSGIVSDNRARILVQRIPYNNGGAVTGPTTVQDQVVTLTNNGTVVNIANNDVNDAYTITVLPPSPTTPTPTPTTPTPSPTTPTPSPTTPTPSPTTPGPGGPGCDASYRVTNSWPGGFQADVAVSNSGSTVTTGWRVSWTIGSGQTINQVWNGSLTTGGATATVGNVSYNGSLAPGASTTFGMLVAGEAGGTPTLTCSVN
ncbi:cellulose binding domain-containing protein [Micromonospora matsumotoense]|uniref:cellulose binding domain-containing protein n=1 Tax=Micromonospora matsumotoense TaxID=121616 RepID=UPI003D9356A3